MIADPDIVTLIRLIQEMIELGKDASAIAERIANPADTAHEAIKRACERKARGERYLSGVRVGEHKADAEADGEKAPGSAEADAQADAKNAKSEDDHKAAEAKREAEEKKHKAQATAAKGKKQGK